MTVLVILCIALLLLVLIAVMLFGVSVGLRQLQADVDLIRQRFIPPNVGGRPAPSPADLEAARNRIDRSGVAHPGGS